MANPQSSVFPYAASGDMTLTVTNDLAQTALNGNIGTSDTVINVTNTAAFVAPCLFVIDNEIILGASISGDAFDGCVRGFAGTTAATHLTATPVYGYVVAYLHNQVAAELNSVESLLFNSNFSGLKKNENLLPYSEAFENNAQWSLQSGATITATTGTSPTGDHTARTFLEGNTFGLNSVSSAFTNPVTGSTYTFSVYAQYINNQWLTIGQDILNETARRVSFDLENGVLGTVGSSATGSIVALANGWYRCLVTTTCTSNSDQNFDIVISDGNNVVAYAGTETQSVMLWGAQVTSGGFVGPMDYVSTNGNVVSILNGGDLVLDYGDLTWES